MNGIESGSRSESWAAGFRGVIIRLLSWPAAVVCAAALLVPSGCMVGPNFDAPHPQMPAKFHGAGPDATTQPSVAVQTPVKVVEWWKTFNDPALNSLIQRAAVYNLDVKLAQSRLMQARAQRGVVASAFWPGVNANAGYTRSYSGGSNINANGGGSVAGINLAPRDVFQVGFDASWELDFFGGVRRNIEAADADIQAAVEDRRSTLVTLLAEVAQNYIQARGYQKQIAIAKNNLVAQQRTAEVTRKRTVGGLAAGLDVANAEAQVATTASQIPLLESQLQQTIYAISVLLGQEPAALLNELSTVAPIPGTPPVVPVGLPSELLRRRPDIRRAEAQWHGATARVGVATADLFPKFSLTGSVGLQTNNIASLFNWASRAWSFGPSITWPVFDAGRIQANILVQSALQDQASLQYQKAILIALQDVENALVAYAKEQEHFKALSQAVAANRRAVDLATRLYQQGLTNFLNVLDAERSLYGSEDALVQSERNVSVDLVALYKALGGGWESGPAQ